MIRWSGHRKQSKFFKVFLLMRAKGNSSHFLLRSGGTAYEISKALVRLSRTISLAHAIFWLIVYHGVSSINR